jgi:mono/diheme cytochrome c family protein
MRTQKIGQAPLAALFWIAGLGLVCLPFLRKSSAADPEGTPDPRREASEIDIPFAADLANFEEQTGTPLADELAAEAEARFGTAANPKPLDGLLNPSRVRAGSRAYNTHCVGCHGTSGDGAGPAARFLNPRPRNMRRGLFKFASTANGERPLPADLFATITRGLKGSSMPEFRLLSEELRWDLVEYVRYLAIRGEFEQLALDLAWEEEALPDFDEVEELIRERWDPDTLRSQYPPMVETPADQASVERGRALYFDASSANCAACHGEKGVGDGPSATAFLDGWGYPIRPRDLTTGVYRAGTDTAALYRTVALGINGTPMPSYKDSLDPEEIWDLVHFVQSLSK